MANSLLRCLRRASTLLNSQQLSLRSIIRVQEPIFTSPKHSFPFYLPNPSWVCRGMSHGSVKLVICDGKPKFETYEIEAPKKEKWKTKKRLKMQRKREKEKRKAANRKDPRRLTIRRKKKHKFANPEERIKTKLERARMKEAALIERLKRYEVPRVQGPEVQPHNLTGEERFFLKKMAQKKSNYVPIGRRGVFGGVILNMHMHWKKHETVKVICRPCKPGQLQQFAQELARLSGGVPINTIGDDTVVFYRGKNYVQPEVMSPIDTLSKKRALEKSKYEQSLETVRHFIMIAEKELELYHRHMALYGDSNNRNPLPNLDTMDSRKPKEGNNNLTFDSFSSDFLGTEADCSDEELPDIKDYVEDDKSSMSKADLEDENLSDFSGTEADSSDEELSDIEDDKLSMRLDSEEVNFSDFDSSEESREVSYMREMCNSTDTEIQDWSEETKSEYENKKI